jgi:O-antigen/teichoic acid export membrane protein
MRWEFEKGGLIVFAISMLTNAFSLLFQIAAGRSLPVADYGTLNFLLALVLVLTVPALALGQSVSRDVASWAAAGSPGRMSGTLKNAASFAGFYSVAAGAALLLVFRLTDAPALIPVLLVFIIALTCYAAPLIGVAQGLQMSAAMVVGYLLVALFKFAGALLTGTLSGILLMNLAGCAAAFCCLYLLLARRSRECRLTAIAAADRAAADYRYLLSACLLNVLFMYMPNCDALLLRWIYGDHALGLYSPAMNFGRMVCYIASPVSVSLFSFTLKEEKALAGNSLRLYLKALAFILGISLLFLLFTAVWGERLIILLFGDRYTSGARYLVPAILLGISVSLCSLAMYYQLAVGRLKPLLGSFAAGAAAASVIIPRASPDAQLLITGLTAVFFAVFMVNFVIVAARGRMDSGIKPE